MNKKAPLTHATPYSFISTGTDIFLSEPSFERYSGDWTFIQAAHLLRRCTFGPGKTQLQWSVEMGLDATLDKLFEDLPMPAPPVNYYYKKDRKVNIGETWINAPYNKSNDDDELTYRQRSLFGWTIGLMLNEGISIREKLTLFWHNHFAINSINDPKFLYRYITLLRTYAWGNFRDLTKKITIDPAMLRFLNGNRNQEEAPNENYARELLELFTIGKGSQVEQGDYSNYTELDIREMARVLSGWRDFGFVDETTNNSGAIGATFRPFDHDKGEKKLSHRFDNETISNLGEQEYDYLIDIIFQKKEVARFICRKLYQWFVDYKIESSVEKNVIETMAQVLLNHDFEIKPALRALLSCQHFFESRNVGLMIKNPLDFMMSVYKPLYISMPSKLDQLYDAWYRLFGFAELMQMTYFDIPEVAGWSAYYRQPLFYRLWLNSSTLPVRMEFVETLLTEGYFPFQANGPKMKVNVFNVIATLDDPYDPNSLIEELTSILLPKPLNEVQHLALKEILLPGLPDYEWGVEYSNYLQNPEDSDLAASLSAKLVALFKHIMNLAEFQLS